MSDSCDMEESKKKTDDQNVKPSPFSDAVYRELSRINGRINQMSNAAVCSKVRELKLNSEGSAEILRKRLKNYYKKQKLTSVNLLSVSKLFPFYVIVDFEATCEEVNPPNYPHEIIEFPAVLVDTEKQCVVDNFQSFCKPTLNPVLTDFCIALTGITQDQVDSAKPFPEVLADFEKWLSKHKLGMKHKYAIVTDGPWDMGRFLYGQCEISNIPYPSLAKKWINIRKVFSNFYRCKKSCLKLMLEHLQMDFEGRQHCGLDDARNIARILLRLVTDGASIQYNERIHLPSSSKPSGNKRNEPPARLVVPIMPSEPLKNITHVRRQRGKWESRQVQVSEEDTDEENCGK
ncbi:3'-5' exoribonuclease 1-like [Bacillus rossius redtenbacheri]|uniref:3'-5' exoribonuclease 1-like n=1 Tax=Bacillus rossius redtenbacheri TaxID=93214 RepID=UPI002FDD34BD